MILICGLLRRKAPRNDEIQCVIARNAVAKSVVIARNAVTRSVVIARNAVTKSAVIARNAVTKSVVIAMGLQRYKNRHCEERSDAAIYFKLFLQKVFMLRICTTVVFDDGAPVV